MISPEGCATILFKDALAAPRAAAALQMTAPTLLRLGIVDAVVLEPEAGAHTDQITTAENLKTAIVTELHALLALCRPMTSWPSVTSASACSAARAPSRYSRPR